MTDANAKICIHLLPFLTELERRGASIVETYQDAWSNCRLSIVLDANLSIAEAEKMFSLPPEVKLWHNDDGHYALENGLFCETCKHSLSWPRVEREKPTF